MTHRPHTDYVCCLEVLGRPLQSAKVGGEPFLLSALLGPPDKSGPLSGGPRGRVTLPSLSPPLHPGTELSFPQSHFETSFIHALPHPDLVLFSSNDFLCSSNFLHVEGKQRVRGGEGPGALPYISSREPTPVGTVLALCQ